MLSFQRLIALRYLALGQRRLLSRVARWPLVFVVLFLVDLSCSTWLQHSGNLRVQQFRADYGWLLVIGSWVLAIAAILVAELVGLAWRFTIFTTISIYGLFLGSAALVIVLSVMSGFEGDLKHKILGTNAHIVVTRNDHPFTDYGRLRDQPGERAHLTAHRSSGRICGKKTTSRIDG